MRFTRSFRRASLLGVALTLTVATSVFAHDCYNASTSAQGALAKAENSQAWTLAVDVRELIATGGSGFFPVGSFPVLDTCQQQAFLAAYAQTGFPLVFTTGIKQAQGQGGVIADNNPNMSTSLGGNGKGIDHFEITGDAIFGALATGYDAAYSASCPANQG